MSSATCLGIHAQTYESRMQYRVLPIMKQNITQGFETLIDPQNTAPSPFGWHSDGPASIPLTTLRVSRFAFRFSYL